MDFFPVVRLVDSDKSSGTVISINRHVVVFKSIENVNLRMTTFQIKSNELEKTYIRRMTFHPLKFSFQ